MTTNIKYSVFTPIYNEEGNIEKLYNEVKPVMEKLGETWEFILVNDGSRDNSMREILKIAEKDERIIPIALKTNYGQSIAMDAGFNACRGEIVISMDADLQNDPKDIPKLLEKLHNEHLDVVAGWRAKRKDPMWMLVITKAAKFLRGLFASDGVHDSGCTLRVYRRHFIEDLELWGEMHRYIMAILKWKGARIGELKVNHRARSAGVSKYNWKKSFKGLVDLFYVWFWKKFSGRPLHLFGVSGLFIMFAGVLSGIWTAYQKIFLDVSLSDSVWFLMSGFLFLIGLQFFVSGIMLDIAIRNYFNTSKEKRYNTREVVLKRKRK